MSKNCISGAKFELNRKLNTDVDAVSGQPVIVSQLIGTCETDEDSDGDAIVNVSHSAVYLHDVRNVLTYNESATPEEATWGAIAEGDYIYIDYTSDLPADVYLTTSPLDEDGGSNKLFGKALTTDATASAKTCSIEVEQVQV